MTKLCSKIQLAHINLVKASFPGWDYDKSDKKFQKFRDNCIEYITQLSETTHALIEHLENLPNKSAETERLISIINRFDAIPEEIRKSKASMN